MISKILISSIILILILIAIRSYFVIKHKSGFERNTKITTDDLKKLLHGAPKTNLNFHFDLTTSHKPMDIIIKAENIINKLYNENVLHTEIFFDPQILIAKDIPFFLIADSLNRGLDKGRNEYKLSLKLVVSISRDLKNKDIAFGIVDEIYKYNKYILENGLNPEWKIIGVGLNSYNKNNTPESFKDVFKYASACGLYKTAYCGEEEPTTYIWTAIQQLNCSRIDHGARAIDDPGLCSYLATPQSTEGTIQAYGSPHKIALVCCPTDYEDPKTINIGSLLNMGIMCSINTGDNMNPNDGVNDCWDLIIDKCVNQGKSPITFINLKELVINGFEASWISDYKKEKYIDAVNQYFLLNSPSLYNYIKSKK